MKTETQFTDMKNASNEMMNLKSKLASIVDLAEGFTQDFHGQEREVAYQKIREFEMWMDLTIERKFYGI